MSLMKQKIMDSADRFFTEKGYNATSIQEIADDCCIAKGSLYKFFPSKEDLFIEIIRFRQVKMFECVERMISDETLTKREAFIREIGYQFELFLDSKCIMREIKELNLQEGGKYSSFMFDLRVDFFKYYRDCLVRMYGAKIEPNVWDLVTMLLGMIREYVFMIVFQSKPLDIGKLSAFIASRMDDMVSGILETSAEPVLKGALMPECVQADSEWKLQSISLYKSYLFTTLMSTAQELPIPNSRKTELCDSIELLHQEYESAEPKNFLVHALLHYLATEDELKGIAKQLEHMYEKR